MSADTAYQKTEKKLIAYFRGEIQEDIQNRLLELKYPKVSLDEIDIKIMVSKKVSSPQERSTIKIMNDRELAILERRQKTIENFLSGLTQHEYEILSQFYLKRKFWKEIAIVMNYSERHCRRMRTQLIEELTERLSWDD